MILFAPDLLSTSFVRSHTSGTQATLTMAPPSFTTCSKSRQRRSRRMWQRPQLGLELWLSRDQRHVLSWKSRSIESAKSDVRVEGRAEDPDDGVRMTHGRGHAFGTAEHVPDPSLAVRSATG